MVVPKKDTKNTNVEEVKGSETNETNVETQTKTNTKKERIKLDPTQEILVASRREGTMVYFCKRSNNLYEWERYGDEIYVTLADLQQINKNFYKNGWIEVIDEDAIEFLRLERYQQNIIDEDLINELLYNTNAVNLKDYLSTTSTNNKTVLFKKAEEAFVAGELTDYNLLSVFKEVIGKDVNPNNR